AAIALAGIGTARLVVDLDPNSQLPASSPYVVTDHTIRQEFGGTNVVALALISLRGTIWRADVLSAVHRVTDDLLSAPGIIRQNVVSLSSPYVRAPIDRDGIVTIEYLMREAPERET